MRRIRKGSKVKIWGGVHTENTQLCMMYGQEAIVSRIRKTELGKIYEVGYDDPDFPNIYSWKGWVHERQIE